MSVDFFLIQWGNTAVEFRGSESGEFLHSTESFLECERDDAAAEKNRALQVAHEAAEAFDEWPAWHVTEDAFMKRKEVGLHKLQSAEATFKQGSGELNNIAKEIIVIGLHSWLYDPDCCLAHEIALFTLKNSFQARKILRS